MSIYETCSETIGALTDESLPLLLECLSDTQQEVREKWHVMSCHVTLEKISTDIRNAHFASAAFPSQQYTAI
jgi:hypothetical protein